MRTVKLGEVVDFYSGATPAKANTAWWQGDVSWFSAKDLKTRMLRDSIDHVSSEVFASTPLRLLPAGTVVMVVRGMILAHTVPICEMAVEGAINQDIKALIPRNTQIHQPYLAHILRAHHQQLLDRVSTAAHGTKKLDARVLAGLEIPLPSLEEQRRIAAILDQADAIRTKRRQVLAHLDALPVSAFLSRFGDPDHATSTITLGEVARLSGGRNLVADDQTQETSFRVLKISAVTSGVFRETESKWLPPGYVPPSAHLVRPGDLLMSRANTAELVGATALVGDASPNLALPDKVWRFEWQSPDTDPLFIQTLLSVPSMRRRISRLASGTGGSMKNVSKEKLMRMPLPEVLAVEQHTFADSIRSAHRSRDLVAHTLDEDDALFASLQARAFRGEV